MTVICAQTLAAVFLELPEACPAAHITFQGTRRKVRRVRSRGRFDGFSQRSAFLSRRFSSRFLTLLPGVTDRRRGSKPARVLFWKRQRPGEATRDVSRAGVLKFGAGVREGRRAIARPVRVFASAGCVLLGPATSAQHCWAHAAAGKLCGRCSCYRRVRAMLRPQQH